MECGTCRLVRAASTAPDSLVGRTHLIGGWQTSFNMFAKTGTAFTPFWICNNCGPVTLGNIGVGSVDAVGDFNGPSFRPVIIGDVNHRSGDQIWDPAAFDLPPLVPTCLAIHTWQNEFR